MKTVRGPGSIAVVLQVLSSLAPTVVAQIEGGTLALTGNDTVPRFFHGGSRLNHGLVMVSGGLGLTIIPPSLFSRSQISFFDPNTGTFSAQFQPLDGGPLKTPVLSVARSSHTQTTLLDGRVLIAGGLRDASGTNPGMPFDGVELFDPQTGLIASGPSMSEPRAMHTATRLNDGGVLVAGGSTWQVFDPLADAWSPPHALVHSRVAHAAVHLPSFADSGERVLVIAGAGSGPRTMELLDPASGKSTPLSSLLSVGVDDLAAIRTHHDTVFIVGGQDVTTGDTVNNAWVLNPITDVLQNAASAPLRPNGISDHQMARFGRYIVIFGGEEQVAGQDTELDYAAIYDVGSANWYSVGTMNQAHDDFAAVELADGGWLLIDGGIGALGQELPTPTCEIFRLALEPCPGDATGDGQTNQADLGLLLAHYGLAVPAGTNGDLDHNGWVDQADLGFMLSDYGCH